MKAGSGGAASMATGICIMHYSGMHAMKMQPGIIWSPVLVATSALIAFLASGVALWIVFHLRRITSRRQLLARIGAALVMGFAVVGMHYTGMAAASFPLGAIRSEEHKFALQSLMRISYAVFCLEKKIQQKHKQSHTHE